MIVRTLRPLAEQGDAEAQLNLGLVYYLGQGEGMPQNHVLAYMWFSVAADSGHKHAAKMLNLLADKMPSALVAESRRLVQERAGKNYKDCP